MNLLAGFLGFVMVSQIHGVDSMHGSRMSYGYQKYGKETVESIEGNGSVILEETNVLGLVQVDGSLRAEESTINSLQVNGSVELHNCLICQSTTINGSLTADNSKFIKNDFHITLKSCLQTSVSAVL